MNPTLSSGCACGRLLLARRAWTLSVYADIEEAGELLGPLVTTVIHTSVGEVVGNGVRWHSLGDGVTAERDPQFIDDRLDAPVALGPRSALMPKLAVLDRVTVECPACGASREVLDERRVLE